MATENQTIALEKLSASINRVLKKYVDDVEADVGEIAEKLASRGVSALKSSSPVRTGKYAKGWTKQVDRTRIGTTVTIYNRRPGIPHLQEHGHVKRNGTGRVNGNEHIAPVEKQVVEAFQKEVEARL